jgi:hypothetical protein
MKKEKTLKTEIEKTVKSIKKYMGYLKDENCTDIKVFKAVLNSKLWDLAMHQVIDFDLTNQFYCKIILLLMSKAKLRNTTQKITNYYIIIINLIL